MDIKLKVGKIDAEKCEALACFIGMRGGEIELRHENLQQQAMRRLVELRDFSGAVEEVAWLYPSEGQAKRLLLIGIGEYDKVDVEILQQAIGRGVQAVRKSGAGSLCLSLEHLPLRELAVQRKSQLVVEALLLANYQFAKYKTNHEGKEKPLRGATIVLSERQDLRAAQEGMRRAEVVAKWTCFARDLQNTPANDMTPERLARIAKEQARDLGVSWRVFDKEEIAALKMGALLGVGQGSVNEPRFIVLEHRPKKNLRAAKNSPSRDTLVFVGKGITFDTGGISIKPSEGLETMKYDMSGAATALAAIGALAELGLPLHVVGLLPCAENMPGGRAQRPGDVVRACNGKTIEVADTDAEGRLVLADALAYAHRYKPAAVIDLATLTGSVYAALGATAAGLLSTDNGMIAWIKKAAELTGERVWHLPLFKEFFEAMKSDIADIRNIPAKSCGGGASTGAAFLATFAEGYPWAHLDIAAVAHPKEDTPITPKGGSGWGVRLLVQFCYDWIEQERHEN